MGAKKEKICLLCENIEEPFDEGMKKTIVNYIRILKSKRNVHVFGRDITGHIGRPYRLNRLFLNQPFKSDIRDLNPDVVLYFPEASLTAGALIRGKVISYYSQKPVAIVGLQVRKYSMFAKLILRMVRPDLLFLQSRAAESFYRQQNFKTAYLRSGIDLERFYPISERKKMELRKKWRLPLDKKILLHVGHINENRGLFDLFEIASHSNHVLIIGSTSTVQDEKLKKGLISRGATVVDDYVETIEEIYQMADLYVFPTRIYSAAMEFPLSVLEAMACGLPILTVPYGGLVDYFEKNQCFQYYRNPSDARTLAAEIFSREMNCCHSNVENAEKFNWGFVAEDLLVKLDEL